MKNNKFLKASSLTNTIFICLIISVFCGSLVLISFYQNSLNSKLYLKENLIYRNNSSFNHFINNLSSYSYNNVHKIDVFDDHIYSSAVKKQWGFYDVLICKSVINKDSISKIALVGVKDQSQNNLALYVTNYDKPLKLSGKSAIYGTQKIPLGQTKLSYINGLEGNKVQLKGIQLPSEKKFPKLNAQINVNPLNYERISLSSLEKGATIINSFDNETIVIETDNMDNISHITCKGNFILVSKGPLQIDNTAILNDILVMAPKIKINSGFKGNIQIIAKQQVEVASNVSMLYPSSIYLKNDRDSVSVTIHKNSKLIGGIVIDGDLYYESLKRRLFIDENAVVIGNVYCFGSTCLQGKVIGSIYTDRFHAKTQSSDYEDTILNGIIDKDSLPGYFIELPLFKNNIKNNYEIIKEF